MDNSPAWDDPLAAVPKVDWSYDRRDLGHVDSEQRPHKPEYDRYLYLVDFYKQNKFDSKTIFANCPYRVADIGIISILQRAGKDLVELCQITSHLDGVEKLQNELDRTAAAINSLWSNDKQCFLSRNLITGEPLDEITTATVLPLFGGLANDSQAEAMIALIDEWLDATNFGLSSTHPSSDRYEPQRYWRGPVWPHINWMVAAGAIDYGHPAIGQQLRDTSVRCIQSAGFWEYFDASNGTGCGGDDFSWTAAIALHWLSDRA